MAEKRIFLTYPLSLGVSGGGTVGCIEIARHLRELGALVGILSVQVDAARGGFGRTPLDWIVGSQEKAALEQAGIPVHSVPPSRIHYSLDRTGIRAVVRKLQAQDPVEAVISWHHELFGMYGFLKNLGIRTGMITAAPSYQEFPGKTAFTRRLRKRVIHACLRSSDRVFAPSQYIRSSILQTPGVSAEKVIHAPWGVARRFHDTRPAPALNGTFRMMFFGWWVHAKGFFDLLDALAPLAGADWELEIAGWGSEQDIRHAARKNGIEGQIRILGKLDHDELIVHLERANLAVLPSYIESFGLAVAEAQACGCPVLAYEVGAVPETVIDGQTGWLVPRGNIPALTARIAAAMANPAEARLMGLCGRDRVQQHFSWQKTAATILEEIA